jgi:hypothetical protein
MTLCQLTIRGNIFARNNLADFVPLPAHSALLPPSVTMDLVLNYKWRFIVVHVIEQLYELNMHSLPESEQSDFDKRICDLLVDIYN